MFHLLHFICILFMAAATFGILEYCYKIHEGKSENVGTSNKNSTLLTPPSPRQLTAKLRPIETKKSNPPDVEIFSLRIEIKYKNHQSRAQCQQCSAGDEAD